MMSPTTRWRRCGATVLLLAAGAVALVGCAGQSTPASRYTLPEPSVQRASDAGALHPRQLRVSPVEVASYLDQEGIVMQLSDIELNAANRNLWAEDLGQQLTRRLRQSLTANLPRVTVLGSGQGDANAWRLSISVDQFQGRYDGRAVASGEWQLYDGNRLLAQRRFDVTRALGEDGYPALVRTLGEVWERVGEQIADGIRTADSDTLGS